MAYVELSPYLRGTRPQMVESEREYIDKELKKIEAAIRSLIEAVQELREKKANV